jgi:hypothetical protein
MLETVLMIADFATCDNTESVSAAIVFTPLNTDDRRRPCCRQIW